MNAADRRAPPCPASPRAALPGKSCVVLIEAKLVVLLVTVIGINLTVDSAQGRYMFPALPAIALLLGLGLESLRVWSKNFTWLVIGGWAVSNIIILVFLVTPAYWPPALR
jgi:hypothetical protein